MPSSRPPATPIGTATRIEASVTMALVHWPNTARKPKQAATKQREAATAGVVAHQARRMAMTAIQDSGGRICTALDPCPDRKPVDSRLSARR